jgi:hypothetical protein
LRSLARSLPLQSHSFVRLPIRFNGKPRCNYNRITDSVCRQPVIQPSSILLKSVQSVCFCQKSGLSFCLNADF